MNSKLNYNKIAEVSLDQFSKLPKAGKPTEHQWTILATIIQENSKNNSFEVVALGTGSKCIGVNQMSAKGDILNDSHAEVICRRSFIKYLYLELKNCIICDYKSDIFDFNFETKKFSVKKHFNFHFYTTHVPCGDAAIFPKNFQENSAHYVSNLKRHNEDAITSANKKLKKECECMEDIYRTGAKCIPNGDLIDSFEDGANYHAVGPIRTKPGRGDPTLSVSCSDKIAKWCYLGIQGTLLSLLLSEPIYLKSFTIAGNVPYSNDAFERAFIKRFQEIRMFGPFKRHDILINQSDFRFEFQKADNKVPCPSSILWWKNIKKVEVSVNGRRQGITKKMVNTKESRLSICKIELMGNFIEISELLQMNGISKAIQYNKLKYLCTEYQKAWNILKCNIFKGYISKDPKLLCFTADQ